jgi:hypothetical protein
MVHEILGMDELPKPGFVVAIDAEFVQMQQVSLPTRQKIPTFGTYAINSIGRD